jgi:hypothetical protein
MTLAIVIHGQLTSVMYSERIKMNDMCQSTHINYERILSGIHQKLEEVIILLLKNKTHSQTFISLLIISPLHLVIVSLLYIYMMSR